MKAVKAKVGLVGAGYIADWHAKALALLPNVKLVSVCDVSLSQARSLAEKYHVAGVYGSSNEMLSNESLDAVHVLVPPDRHLAVAEEMLDAGVRVLVEKPMCSSAAECRRLAAKCASSPNDVAVSHNFLFLPVYEKLMDALKRGMLGKLEQVNIVWNRELGQLKAGPYGAWMLREPANLLLEIGSHSIAHLLHLVGMPDEYSCKAFMQIELPGGKKAYRRWEIQAFKNHTLARVTISAVPGFTEHYIHIRGTLASATVDFHRNSFVLRRATPYGIDFDRYFSLRNEAKALKKHAFNTLRNYALAKFKLSKEANPFGYSITRVLESFYSSKEEPPDERISADFGLKVVEMCENCAAQGLPEPHEKAFSIPEEHPVDKASTAPDDKVLVFGGTGFIGRHLVSKLVQTGRQVRLFTRQTSDLPDDLSHPNIEKFSGSIVDGDAVERAVEGVKYVYHLARANVKTRREYSSLDIESTQRLAEICIENGIERFIYTGTIDSYYAGCRAGEITEETPLDPAIRRRNNYAWTKAKIERNLRRLHKENNLPLIVMRPGIVLGSGGSPFHWGVGMWFGHAVCRLWGDGNNKLPLVLVEDVADALAAALDRPDVVGHSFNLIDMPLLSAREYCHELKSHLGMAIDVRPTPIWKFYATDMGKWVVKCMVRHHERRRPSHRDWKSRTQKALFNCDKTRTMLDWTPASDRDRMIREGIQIPADEYFY